MTPTLRRFHRYTWFSLAILLPLGWLAAIWVIPEIVWQMPVRIGQPDPLALLLQSKDAGDFVFNLRQDSANTQRQIEIFIKKPLSNPSTAVMIETSDATGGKKERLLGLLGSRGVWRFDLDSFSAASPKRTIKLVDKIQN
jgi:hypothetical protein